MPRVPSSRLFLLVLLLAGCVAGPRVVPVPAPGVAVDQRTSVTTSADGVQFAVQPSAWQGSPSYLPDYVTPFHLLIANGSGLPLQYDYGDIRLFDELRFQYTAIPPADVAALLRAASEDLGVRVAAAETEAVPLHRHRPFFWDPWWWGPPYYPYPYYSPPRVGDVFTRALPVGALQPGGRVEGYVYFPRLRPEASRLTFELHYRLGGAPRVLTLPFAIERAEGQRLGRG